MKNLLISSENLTELPKIEKNEIRLLWANDWFDGVINGILLYKNKKCRFELIEENSADAIQNIYRKYLVIELTEEQLQEEEYWHKLFVENVGSHFDFDENENLQTTKVKPQETWEKFYKLYEKREEVNLSKNKFLGYYEN
jgi:hypothetical protein